MKCTLANTWYPVAGAFTNSPLEGFTFDTDRITYRGTKTKTFIVTGAIATSGSNPNLTISYAISVNGTVFTRGITSAFCASAGNPYNLAGITVVELSENDYVQIVTQCDVGNRTVTTGQLMVQISEFFD